MSDRQKNEGRVRFRLLAGVPEAEAARLIAVDRILFAFLAAELRRQNELLLEALFLPVERRLRRRLLELARVYGGGRDGQVEIPLTQAELAAMAGRHARPRTKSCVRSKRDE